MSADQHNVPEFEAEEYGRTPKLVDELVQRVARRDAGDIGVIHEKDKVVIKVGDEDEEDGDVTKSDVETADGNSAPARKAISGGADTKKLKIPTTTDAMGDYEERAGDSVNKKLALDGKAFANGKLARRARRKNDRLSPKASLAKKQDNTPTFRSQHVPVTTYNILRGLCATSLRSDRTDRQYGPYTGEKRTADDADLEEGGENGKALKTIVEEGDEEEEMKG